MTPAISPNLVWNYSIIATLPVTVTPGTPLFDPQNGDIYVPSTQFGNQISVISGSSNTVIANVTVSYGEKGLTFDPDNGDIYVSNRFVGTTPLGSHIPASTLLVISGATNTVVANVTFPSSLSYHTPLTPPVFDPANGDIYLASPNGSGGIEGTVWVISGTTNTVVATVKAPFPQTPFFDSANGEIYISDNVNSTVSIISSATNTIVATAAVEDALTPVLDTESGNLYFPNLSGMSLTVLSGKTNAVVANIAVGHNHPLTPVFDPENGNIYVPCTEVNSLSGSIWVVSGRTNEVIANIAVGDNPRTPAIDTATGDIIVPAAAGDTISIISGTTSEVLETLKVGNGPLTPTFDPENGDAYVPNNNTGGSPGTVSVISASNLLSSLVSHLAKLENLDSSGALADYATNATMIVSGVSQGAGPATGTRTYTGTGEICTPLNYLFGGSSCLSGFPLSTKSFQFTIQSFNTTRLPDGTVEISANLAFVGSSGLDGAFNGTISARYEYTFQHGTWLISQEDWNFTRFDVQYAQH